MLLASTSKNETLMPYFKKKEKNSFEYLKELECILLFLSFL